MLFSTFNMIVGVSVDPSSHGRPSVGYGGPWDLQQLSWSPGTTTALVAVKLDESNSRCRRSQES